MSKAKEYIKKFKEWENNHEYNFYDDLKEINHKTLEDVEELIVNRIQKYASELHADNEPRRFELIEILDKLKSLKL